MSTPMSMTPLEELMATRQETVDPSQHPSEVFELFSIPAYDSQTPEVVEGSAIGSAKKCVEPGDVLLSRIVPHIRRAWVVPEANGHRQIASGEWIVFRSKKFNASYLRHLLMSDVFHAQFMNTVAGVGGSLLRARPAFVAEIEIPLPPLPEQMRIADILDKADAIRRKRRAVVSNSAILTKSVFRSLLGDPATNPHGWQVMKLGDVVNFVGGSQPPKETFISEPRDDYVRLIQIRDFKTDAYPTYIPKELARRNFEEDDVMIARYGPPVFQILRGLSGSYNVALMKAEPTSQTTKDFLFHLLQIPEIHDVVVANSSRTAGQSGVNLDLLCEIRIPIPPVVKQKTISQALNSIESFTETATRFEMESIGLFNSLVQRAFRGEL
jgi:type I restriction enzyme S subunit